MLAGFLFLSAGYSVAGEVINNMDELVHRIPTIQTIETKHYLSRLIEHIKQVLLKMKRIGISIAHNRSHLVLLRIQTIQDSLSVTVKWKTLEKERIHSEDNKKATNTGKSVDRIIFRG